MLTASPSATGISALATNPRNRREWTDKSRQLFGYNTELIRASARDRDQRFVLAQAQSSNGTRSVTILGTGNSWQHAYERARTSDTGIAAIGEHDKIIAMIGSAIGARTAGDFADGVMRATLKEAKESGFTPEQLDELKKRFDDARKLINDADYSERPEDSEPEGHNHATGGNDHAGAGAEDRTERPGDAGIPDPH